VCSLAAVPLLSVGPEAAAARMRILHVFSANFFAGSVAYALQLAEAHQAQGHQVWLLSDSDQLPTRAIQLIRRLVHDQQIDVVHAHSRAASWVAYFALLGTKVPLVSTTHGRQHLHASTTLFDMYGDKVIAICANLKTHLVQEVQMQPTKIVAIPNGIAFDAALKEESGRRNEELGNGNPLSPIPPSSFPTPHSSFLLPHSSLSAAPKAPRLAFIGRFNGGKGERAADLLLHVFPVLLAEFPTLRLALIGGEMGEMPARGKAALALLQADFGERVEVVGFTDDVPGWLARTTLVIGAGRVAMEALGAGRNVLALGEAGYAGLVTEATFETAAASNFGDISARSSQTEVNSLAVLADAQAFLSSPRPVPLALGPLHRVAQGCVDAAGRPRQEGRPAELPRRAGPPPDPALLRARGRDPRPIRRAGDRRARRALARSGDLDDRTGPTYWPRLQALVVPGMQTG